MRAEVSGEVMQIEIPDENFFSKVRSLEEQASDSVRLIKVSQSRLKCLSPKGTKRFICEQNTNPESVLGLHSNSDLMPGIYEGGFKIWECSHDLLQYLDTHVYISDTTSVLEIGCGAGLLGIYSLTKGARSVHFQDFNSDVLKWFTLPNVALNIPAISENMGETINTKCKFFAGDWKLVNDKVVASGMKYDLILTSETIYNAENHSILVELIKNCLSENGVAFVAAKSYYFGVGGGILDFQQFIQSDPRLICEECFASESTIPRIIIKINFKQ
ncbi:histidine protein methyltransferase 1-like protein [Leptotrombidium deliense]|uniref:protein-histidine N-methyltransferase n=1 Tax=Leptotrombidium deliense TaxID=299467 RepID=A0A443SH07_9ACAR|nr:histidine protein methyltransferase 1-like protein [Leptotrombidium deliense]